ncbi:CocE/NonD family hydrolase [Streptomyces lunaelactis]|uniref:CocE/NonD family hydrolase n=1 Tax=Streptomyces lunaelactis TaxID=1535768 RepID=UPI001585241A|nr:CocE/NonD family hydrolase [Streptomyces lunaelactis]NUK34342.1 CocE/NonD family hydrolase [Streptomyces lunaelactis]NUK41147.1 CocE/NonD family hydrolase [Streptomyces lunaelactis]NUK92597.1 CocE/NonD family hydrolase [Streptomyces lunaelactis]NUL29777.1 CocE/NonD family hydrolase [Streptomyces lunaelactis]
MRIRTDFPYETAHEDVRIPLADGTKLYARIWRPLTDEPVPALLEYQPYRLSDWTAPRDRQRHPWYAGHGYASVRVDVRGHGNSEGLPGDEYDTTELADGVEVVNWLARQPWCTGRVGMFGISWGGIDALQIAALAPEPLKAIVTVCSSDDRYDNDAHYMGGSVLAVDMHARAAALLALVARPPDPLFAGDEWRELWLKRLEAVAPFVHTWLAHQIRDDYWKHASVCEDYSAIDAAVLAVGGWHDPYRDTVLRLVEHLPPDRVRGLIGPWPHQYPDRGRPPGPAIGFLQETLRWWDHHLKGIDNDVMSEPLLRSWISESHPPATGYPELPGRWVGDSAWPSPHITPVPYALQGAPVIVDSPQHTGLDAGRFLPLGNDADLPPDQREEDARSACFEFPVTGDPIEILGRPRVTLRLRLDVPHGQAAARVCDVAPDGSSTLVTRGVLNLSARHGRERANAWPLGATEDVSFELNGIGHTFPPGHRIRLAVSSAYWPWIWPGTDSAGFTLDPAGSRLELPVREHTDEKIVFEEPEQSEPLGVSVPATLDEQRPERLITRDVAKGEWKLEADPRYGGTRVHPDGLEFTEDALETYTIQERDPHSAHTRSDWTIRLHRPELAWDVRIETRSEITCDAADFITSDEVVCRHGEEIVFHRTWEKRIPRMAG